MHILYLQGPAICQFQGSVIRPLAAAFRIKSRPVQPDPDAFFILDPLLDLCGKFCLIGILLK